MYHHCLKCGKQIEFTPPPLLCICKECRDLGGIGWIYKKEDVGKIVPGIEKCRCGVCIECCDPKNSPIDFVKAIREANKKGEKMRGVKINYPIEASNLRYRDLKYGDWFRFVGHEDERANVRGDIFGNNPLSGYFSLELNTFFPQNEDHLKERVSLYKGEVNLQDDV